MISYQKLLVPLDGSAQASEALQHAIAIAAGDGAVITLVRVLHSLEELERDPATAPVEGRAEYTQEAMAQRRREEELLEATGYLEDLKRSLNAPGLTVETKIRAGEPAAEILAEIAATGADMVVLTTYGLGGAHILREAAVFGSVADAVLRGSRVPVLVVRPAL